MQDYSRMFLKDKCTCMYICEDSQAYMCDLHVYLSIYVCVHIYLIVYLLCNLKYLLIL